MYIYMYIYIYVCMYKKLPDFSNAARMSALTNSAEASSTNAAENVCATYTVFGDGEAATCVRVAEAVTESIPVSMCA